MAQAQYDDFWNPPDEPPQAQQNPDPKQFVQDTNRWSYHLANRPSWVTSENEGWAQGIYNDPNADPNAAIQRYLESQRAGQPERGEETDSILLGRPGGSGAATQTPSQAWNNLPPAPVAPAAPVAPVAPPPTVPVDLPPLPATPTPEVGASGKPLLEEIMRRARQASAIGRDDANVRAQVDPFVAQQERASRNYLDSIAESGRGRPINMEGDRRMASEKLGQIAGGFEGEIIGREIGARRDEIKEALSMWGDMLTNEQRLTAERELGYLNDRARSMDRTQQGNQFQQDLSWQRESGYMKNDEFMRELALRQWLGEEESDLNWARL